MPSTLVRMKASGDVMERSTWLSAAKWTMAQGRCFSRSALDELGVADVAMDKLVSRIRLEGRQVGEVAGIGEQVEIDHGRSGGLEPAQHEIRADKAGSAGDDDSVLDALVHGLQYMVQNKQHSSLEAVSGDVFPISRDRKFPLSGYFFAILK